MEQVLVPALKAKGVTKEGDVVDAIGSIFSNRTASNLFAQMYLQREQIHKNAKLNAGAFDIEQLNTQAQGSTTGKELEAKAKLHDAYLRFGQTILPVYTKALEIAAGAFQSFTGWMEKNPTLAKALGVGLLVIATSLIAIGGALLVFSPLILGMLSLRLIMASTATSGSVLVTAFSKVPTVFGLLQSAISGIGSGFLSVSRLMMANPMLLVFTAIAAAVIGVAYLIYRNWEPIKTFFTGLWNSLKSVFSSFTNWLTNSWTKISTSVSSTAASLWDGVGNAFNTGIEFVKNTIRKVDSVFAENPILNILIPFIGIPRTIIANWSSITAFFSNVWKNIKDGASNAWLSITAFFSPIGVWFSSKWAEVKQYASVAWSSLANGAFSAWNAITLAFVSIGAWFSTRWELVKQATSMAWSSIKVIVNNAWSSLINTIANSSLFQVVVGTWGSVMSFLTGLKDRMLGIGRNIIDGLIDGIKSGFEKLKSIWSTINSYMPDFMRKKMDIHSPSRVMAALGGHVMGGIRVGLEQGFPSLKSQFSNVMDFLTPQLAHFPQKLDIAPVVPHFKLPKLIQRMHVESEASQPILPNFKLLVDKALSRLNLILPNLSQKLNIQPVVPQIKMPELIQHLGIQPVVPQFKLPELIQRMHVESETNQPVLPNFKLLMDEALSRLNLILPNLSQKLNIQPVIPQFKLPELMQHLGIQTTVLRATQPNLAEFTEKINVAPALDKIHPVQRLSGSNRGDVIVQGDTITIQIHAAPGQNLQQLQNMIEGVLNRRDQQKQARARSSYMDDE